jgi:hypothetical protein
MASQRYDASGAVNEIRIIVHPTFLHHVALSIDQDLKLMACHFTVLILAIR